ncbi:MAG TPA: ATP-binding protein [Thermomicrobiales bacterium]|nr:ATP-binding protein [Thermomicrobiales bacterium]
MSTPRTGGVESASGAGRRDLALEAASGYAPAPRSRLVRRLLRLPILYKVLIANAVIVVTGAVIGTWLTAHMVHAASEGRHLYLALGFALIGFVLSVSVNYLVLRAAFQPLHHLERVAEAVRRGDLSERVEPATFDDPRFSNLAATFNATLDELDRDRHELRALASQVIRAQEQERERVARELHDDTAQVLFAQLLRLTTLKSSANTEVQKSAADMEEMTVEALESVRRLALELRPPALDDLGLVAALEGLAQRFSDQLAIPVDYQARGARTRLEPETEVVLYRVAQEALTNILKHSKASRAWIDLDRGEHDVSLSIRDDGVGFDADLSRRANEIGSGLGIFGMQERAALAGGTLRIWHRPGGGTEVFAFIPLTGASPSSVAPE